MRLKVKQVFDGIRGLMRDLLEKAQSAGEVRADLDAADTAGMMLGLMEGAVLLDKTSQRREEVTRAIDFLDGYLRP